MDKEILLVLIGAGAAILGGIIGGWVQGLAWFHYEKKRANLESTERWARLALDWSKSGRSQSFRGADFHGRNLTGVDLGADSAETDVNLSMANLEDANFGGANLQGADLSGARLFGVNFSRANMKGVVLQWTSVSGLDIYTGHYSMKWRLTLPIALAFFPAISILRRVRMTWLGPLTFSAWFVDADLSQSDLSYAILDHANLHRANLRFTQLYGASLHGACLVKADLYGADLSSSDFAFAQLTGANLVSTDLRACNLMGADLTGAQLEGAVYDHRTRWPRNFDPSTTGAGLVTEVPDSGHLDNKAESAEVGDPGHDET